jgi:hypothetical protein
MWGLDKEDYAILKADLAEETIIEPGARGSGSFTARFERQPKAPDETILAQSEHVLGTIICRPSCNATESRRA